MHEQAKEQLLDIAQRSVEAAVRGMPPPTIDDPHPELQREQGCFVTLKNRDELRGCLGRFTSEQPLWMTVRDMARASATEDTRFAGRPITPSELPQLDIEISVLSPIEEIADPLQLQPGKHGIYITKGFASGCFLPQVAAEMGWNMEEFLSFCCAHKAGLSPDAWKEPDTKVCAFTAEILHRPPKKSA